MFYCRLLQLKLGGHSEDIRNMHGVSGRNGQAIFGSRSIDILPKASAFRKWLHKLLNVLYSIVLLLYF